MTNHTPLLKSRTLNSTLRSKTHTPTSHSLTKLSSPQHSKLTCIKNLPPLTFHWTEKAFLF